MHEYLAVRCFFLKDISVDLQYITLLIVVMLFCRSLYDNDIWQAFLFLPVILSESHYTMP